MLAETDVSALCIDVTRVKSLAGEPRKSVSLAAFILLVAVYCREFFFSNAANYISQPLLEDEPFYFYAIVS